MNFAADTLFSSLCHTALEMGGEEQLRHLADLVKNGKLLLSDTFPWKGDTLYLPKPLYRSGGPSKDVNLPQGQRKAMKKLAWVPAELMKELFSDMKTGDIFDARNIDQNFGKVMLNEKADVRTGDEVRPYAVGAFYFEPDAGLYFIAGVETEEEGDKLQDLLDVMGLGGIGGKRSTGLGKFTVDDTIYLNEPFDDTTSWLYSSLESKEDSSMLLTTSLPKEAELSYAMEGASYLLTRRGGFVQSDHFSEEMRKKQVQYFFQAGSVFRHRYEGDLYDVSGGTGSHPVYRYSKPLFLGVSL
jgi:CRISPR-associated protein Csm4